MLQTLFKDTALLVTVLLLDEIREMPAEWLSDAVLLVMVFPLEDSRTMPAW